MNIEELMALADAYAIDYSLGYRSEDCKARAALEAALTEKQDNTAALNVQYHEASMRKFFGAEKQEPVAKPVCNLWVDPETLEYIVDRCDHPPSECIPAYTHPAPVNQQLLKALKALDDHICNNLSSDYPTGIDINYDQPFIEARAAIAAGEKT